MFVLLTMSAAWNLVYGSLHGLDALPGRRNPERERGTDISKSFLCSDIQCLLREGWFEGEGTNICGALLSPRGHCDPRCLGKALGSRSWLPQLAEAQLGWTLSPQPFSLSHWPPISLGPVFAQGLVGTISQPHSRFLFPPWQYKDFIFRRHKLFQT